jgi:Mor family transcriptional regulator
MSNVIVVEQLRMIIGEDAFQKLVKQFPGEVFYIPKNIEHHDKQQRNNLIRADFYNGMDRPGLAVKYGLSEDRIHKITAPKKLRQSTQ